MKRRFQALQKVLWLSKFMMVGGIRIELMTSSVSRKRSPTELTARRRSREVPIFRSCAR